MFKNKKKLLMACAHYWDSPFRLGSHQIATAFVKEGWEVCYISVPVSPFHVLGGINDEVKERFKEYVRGGHYDFDGHVCSYIPGALLTPHNKPVLRNEWVQRNWWKLTFPSLMNKLRKQCFDEVDVIYIENVNYLFLLDKIKHAKSFARVPDKIRQFAKYDLDIVETMEHEMAQKVDVVVYSALGLKTYVEDMKPKKTLHLPNGVNIEHFLKEDSQVPEEYKVIKNPIAIYIGAMDTWFDYELMNKAIKELKDISFVFIGPDKMAHQKISKASNVYILGIKKYDEIPGYLKHANVGLIPFDIKGSKSLIEGVNPLKLYEYMACGLPVVSMEWSELKQLNSPALLCKDEQEFIQAIKTATMISKPINSNIEFAKGHSWIGRVKELLRYLDIENGNDPYE